MVRQWPLPYEAFNMAHYAQASLVEVGRMLAETSHPCLRVHGCAWFMVPDTLFTHDSLI